MKRKFIHVHAMGACWGSRRIPSLIYKLGTGWRRDMSDHVYGRHTPKGTNHKARWPQNKCVKVLEKRKILCLCRESIPGSSRV